MIIVKSEGRLGNQLFVLAALLKTRTNNERLQLFGFQELEWLLDSTDKTIRRARIREGVANRLWKFLLPALDNLIKSNMLGVVKKLPDESRLKKSQGLLPLSVFRGGFCQEESLLNIDAVTELWTRESAKRAHLLASWGLGPLRAESDRVCFVHVRRGDYLSWPSAEFPAALPSAWFREQMERIRGDSDRNVRFLIFSDDPTFCDREFRNIPNSEVVNVAAEESFLVMSHCDAGILSASTFSWWAGRLAAVKNTGPFIGPQHWFGWPRGEWVGEPSRDGGFLGFVPVEKPSNGNPQKRL